MKTTAHTPRILGLLIASLFAGNQSQANPLAANALPTGGTVTSGIGSISSIGNTMSITQGSQNLFTQFDTFNIGASAAVKFLQPSTSAIAVGRVVGADPSQIFGQLSANGQLFLLNPNGIVFGRTAQVNVGGLVASSLKLSDQDILSGKFALNQGSGAGAVRNFGEIIAREGGLVALVAPQVENQGTIRADGGQIALAAGDKVRLELGQGGLISVNVDGGVAQAQIDNSGSLLADGGKIWMTARQAGDLASNSGINQSGVVRANTMAERNGEIWIDGGPQGKLVLDGQTLAMGTGAGDKGGRISATAGDVTVKGQVNASGGKGQGYIEIGGGFQGKNAKLNNANTTTLASTARVNASATADGEGGTAVVWSEQRSNVAGAIEAKGAGAGKGGLVETSSRGLLNSSAIVDVSAASGKHGEWLLDPTTITIAAGAPAATNATDGVNTVDATTISNALNTGANVTVMGTIGINIEADISKTAGAESSLTFTAPGNINLGTVSQSRQISATDAPNSGVTSSLNVTFNGGTGGNVTLYGSISTNGGDVVFDKAVNLAFARPISTSVAQPNNGVPASNPSGNITFNEAVRLIGSDPVTLDTQSVRDGGGNAISVGGNILFNKLVDSLGTGGVPLALTLNTTGLSNGTVNQSGAVTFKGDIGTGTTPLRSLTINGPSTVALGDTVAGLAGTQSVFLKNDGGAVLTFSAPGTIRPALVLNATNTVINVGGFGASGISNYLQSTFDIVKGTATAVNNTASNLTINSERSIRVLDRDILGSLDGTSAPVNKQINVALNSNSLDQFSGGIALEGQRGVNVQTFGGNITLGGASTPTGRAWGVSGEQNTDGILLQNTVLDSSVSTGPTITGGGNITLRGASPLDDGSGGTAVRLFGTSVLNSGTQNILVDGQVTSTSGGAPKDAVLIGSGGTAAVNLLAAGSGNITIVGDASGVTNVAQAGASYNGVELSRGANVRTVDGDIVIKGLGGGGNNVNVGENVGVRLKDSDTQVTSKTGDITLIGQTGGKTSSYAITTSGDDIAIGQRRDQTLARAATGDTFTGNVNLVGDTMKFINNSTNRLRVTTQRNGVDLNTGQVNIRSLHDVDIQIGGTEPTPPSSDNVAMPDKPLYLASEIFSGTNAVFIPGAGEINIGQFGDVNGPVARGETSKTIAVNGATTVRDPLNLLARGGMATGGGNVAINSNLTVRGIGTSPGADRTLNIETAAGVVQTTGASINATNLRVDSGNDVLLLGPNQLGTVAARTNGNVSINNAQALTVGSVGRNFQGDSVAASTLNGVDTQKANTASNANAVVPNRFLSVSTNGSNADLTITQKLNNPQGLVNLSALGETLATGQRGNAINQTGVGTINAADLIVRAQDNSDLTLTGNEFTKLAVDMSTGQGDLSVVRAATTNADITIDSLTIPAAASGATAGTTVNGLVSDRTVAEAGHIYIQNLNGGLTQTATAPVQVGGLAAEVTGNVALTASSSNQINKLAALTTDGFVAVNNQTAMRVDAVNTQNNASTPVGLKNVTGVRAQGTARDATLNVTGANASLTVADVDNNPDININNALSATGNVSLSTTTGVLDVQGAVLASDGAGAGATPTATLSTTGGNITVSKTVTSDGNLAATVSTGAGDISTTTAGTLTSTEGNVALSTVSGNIALAAVVTANGNISAAVTTGAGDITTTSAAALTSSTGNISLSTAAGNIALAAAVLANKNVDVAINGGTGAFSSTAAATITATGGAVSIKTTNGNIAVSGNVTSGEGDIVANATTGGNITIASKLTADNAVGNADIALNTANGTLTLGVTTPAGNEGDLTASGQGDVRLRATSIAQNTGSVITSNGLSARATGTAANSNISLRGDNSFLNLAAATANGTVHVKNTNAGGTNIAEVVGQSANVDTLSGINATGQVTLVSAAQVTQNADATGKLTNPGGLYVDAASGNVALNNVLNELSTVAVKANAANQNVALNSTKAIQLANLTRTNLDASTTAQAGISTAAATGQVSINSGTSTSAGGLNQQTGATLTANVAALQTTGGNITLTENNAINTLAASTSDSLTLVNNQNLSIGSATNQANGQTINGVAVGVSTVPTTDKQLALQVVGDLTQNNSVTAALAAIVATGNVVLSNSGNDVGQFAAKASNVALTDSSGVRFATLTTVLPTPNTTVSGVDTQQFLLNSTGNVTQQSTANVKTTSAQLVTQGGNVTLTNRQNQFAALAGSIQGKGDIYSAVDTSVQTVSISTGLSATSDLQVRTAGNLTLQAGTTVSANNAQLVLAADKAFTNLAGANVINPATGRWLIYDSNLTLQDRLGGLQPNFRRFATRYDQYTPSQVLEAGNGYITDAVVVNPNDAIRQNGGVGSGMATGGSQTPTTSMTDVQNIGAVPVVYAAYGDTPLPQFPISKAAFIDGSQTSVRFDAPVLVQVAYRMPFSIDLNALVGKQQVKGVTMVDGSAPPNWIKYDAEQGVILGRVPTKQNEPFTLVVKTQLADGQLADLNVFISPSAKEEDDR